MRRLCALLAVVILLGTAAAASAAPPRKAAGGRAKHNAPAAKRHGGCSDNAGGRSSLNMSRDHDENKRPRWSCPETEITVPPVWHGDRIECTFEIKNEGTVPLNIKARGG